MAEFCPSTPLCETTPEIISTVSLVITVPEICQAGIYVCRMCVIPKLIHINWVKYVTNLRSFSLSALS